MIHTLSSRSLALVLFSVAVFAGIVFSLTTLLTMPSFSPTYYLQRVQLLVDPTAERAFTYGIGYFSGLREEGGYDLDRAMYFLNEAVKIDPTYPYTHQQLARVHFLRGNFKTALEYINAEIALREPPSPSAYYIRGLIYGFDGAYERAAEDFERHVQLRPDIWAGYNDLAWALIKLGKNEQAFTILRDALEKFPGNAWLLNSLAVSLYETGDFEGAREAAVQARGAVEKLTPADWSAANPGNDPRSAEQGIETFKQATLNNLEKIMSRAAPSEVDLGTPF